jgi:hypothetical protein
MNQADLGKKQDPISKISRAKRARVMNPVIECLPKHYFKPQYSEKKKKKKKPLPFAQFNSISSF